MSLSLHSRDVCVANNLQPPQPVYELHHVSWYTLVHHRDGTRRSAEVPSLPSTQMIAVNELLWMSRMDVPKYATMYCSLYAKSQVHTL